MRTVIRIRDQRMDTSVHWPRSHGQGNKAKVTRGAAGESGGDHVSASRWVDFVERKVGVEFSIVLDLIVDRDKMQDHHFGILN